MAGLPFPGWVSLLRRSLRLHSHSPLRRRCRPQLRLPPPPVLNPHHPQRRLRPLPPGAVASQATSGSAACAPHHCRSRAGAVGGAQQ